MSRDVKMLEIRDRGALLHLANLNSGLCHCMLNHVHKQPTNTNETEKFQGDLVWNEIRDGNCDVLRHQLESGTWTQSSLSQLCGELKTIMTPGGTYKGEVDEQDQYCGQGTMLLKDGSTYDGHWKDNKRHGIGTFRYKDGSSYIGEYVKDMKNGFGIFSTEKLTYSGYWCQGKRHGWGILRETEGKMYEGQWQDDKKVGIGISRDCSAPRGFTLEYRDPNGNQINSKSFNFDGESSCSSRFLW